MKQFNSFAGLAAELMLLSLRLPSLEHELLEDACKDIEKRAKEKIGNYQAEAGPFAAWAPLAESTKAGRTSAGFSEDDPLLRTGDMRDTIEHKVVRSVGHVGSDSDIALYQELGTDRIPARSFLGGSAFEAEPEIRAKVGATYTAFLSGGGQKVRVR